MQVDPIKPKSKPPGTKLLKLNYKMLLSTSAFKFNLRRHTEEALPGQVTGVKSSTRLTGSPALLTGHEPEAGAYTRPHLSST